MAKMNDLAGRNKGKHRDIISESDWEPIEPVESKVDKATEQALDGIDKQVALDAQFYSMSVDKTDVDKALAKALKELGQ
jgi:hypothetical protein